MFMSLYVDNYVHRLVQNKTDGKLVQIEGSANNSVRVWVYYCIITIAMCVSCL